VAKFVHSGKEIELESDVVNGFATFPCRPEHEGRFPMKTELEGIALATDEWLVLYQQDSLPNTTADFVTVRYTDSTADGGK
jgi:hypothetical protein